MNKFHYEEWITIIEDLYSEVKPNMQALYSVKESLDGELAILFVEKVYTFYTLLVTLQEEHSLEVPDSEISFLSFPSDLQKVVRAYSAVLKFETSVEDLTGKKVEIPELFWSIWHDFKKKFLDDFDFTVETSKLEVLARFKDKESKDDNEDKESDAGNEEL